MAQAGGGLVEQEQKRIGGERPRNLEQAELSEREILRALMSKADHADALDLPQGLVPCRLLLAAVEPQRAAEEACRRSVVGADCDIVQHRHASANLHMLERACEAEAGDLEAGDVIDPLADELDLAARRRQRAGD